MGVEGGGVMLMLDDLYYTEQAIFFNFAVLDIIF